MKNTKILVCLIILLSSCSKNLYEFQPNIQNGGRIVALSKDPSNDNKIIAAAPTGGLFVSNSKGAAWTHLNLPVFEMRDVKFSPANNLVIATAAPDLKKINGGGIWRSPDGGKSWTKIPHVIYYGRPIASDGYGISFEPDGSGKVYVGTGRGIAMSNDNGLNWNYNYLL
jgi:photosystem II stability/assembly factor-like uncharacterized protein